MSRVIHKKTKLVFGVGINDADYAVRPKINGKVVPCPFYVAWTNMLSRCYNDGCHKNQPTYIGCTVDSEWLSFNSFKSWMIKQEWEGNALDKDLLIQGNKVYSHKACIFVSKLINSLLNKNLALRGEDPIGVAFHKVRGRYQASCRVYGKIKYLGLYDTPEEAHEAYKKFKYKYIAEIANQQSEPLRTALLNYKIEG
jgi:hypothetical protein